MNSTLLMVQAMSQNVALFCSAIFAGSSIYVSLVETPATLQGGMEMAKAYRLWVHPRPAIVQASFAGLAAVAGILTGVVAGSIYWVAGGIVSAFALILHIAVVIPDTRRLNNIDLASDPKRVDRLLTRLARLHAALSLAGLGALFIFIMLA